MYIKYVYIYIYIYIYHCAIRTHDARVRQHLSDARSSQPPCPRRTTEGFARSQVRDNAIRAHAPETREVVPSSVPLSNVRRVCRRDNTTRTNTIRAHAPETLEVVPSSLPASEARGVCRRANTTRTHAPFQMQGLECAGYRVVSGPDCPNHTDQSPH